MRYCIMDTETSGLFDFKLPADAPGQPRLASIGLILLDSADDPAPRRERRYIRPDGWSMPAEASAINGLTDDFLMTHGQPVIDVLDYYSSLIRDGYVVCAFNAQYDTKIMRGEMRRAGIPDMFEQTPNICLMRGAALALGAGRFIKLSVACERFGIALENPHEVSSDTEGAYGIFCRLRDLGELPEPKVHYAKNRPAA